MILSREFLYILQHQSLEIEVSKKNLSPYPVYKTKKFRISRKFKNGLILNMK